MIAIIDYGVGNLFSLQSSLKFIGADAEVTNDIAKIKAADRIILPGVGAFADAIAKLRESGMEQVVLEEAANGKPLLGICLGMQMLLEKSYEYGEHAGLGLIGGSVKPIAPMIGEGLKVPHIGWNRLIFPRTEKNPSCSNTSTRATVSISYIPTQGWIVMPLFLRERNTAQS